MRGSEFIGKGWRFPIQPDASGALSYSDGDSNVEQSLHILLMTALGERVMRPDFGCKAPRLVFSPGSLHYLRLLETTIREAVRDWEPRVDLDEVRAETVAGQETSVSVTIAYRVRSSNTRRNLVFPYYLGSVESPR
jgi:phage baseplate assembly protein W